MVLVRKGGDRVRRSVANKKGVDHKHTSAGAAGSADVAPTSLVDTP